jgi:predicted nuclease of predicted toxin-antitoxin system
MRMLIDENMINRRLSTRLQAAGHDVVLADDVGLLSVSDARVLAWAVGQSRPVLTRDHGDFGDLHDLVLACGGHHPGMLVVRFDNDPRHNLTDRGIATALTNLEASRTPIRDQIHVLNHWR